MKILGLKIKSLRKIKAAELSFDGKNLVQIRGKNEAGKSTIIDALSILLNGKSGTPEGVISKGESKAEIIGTIDNYTVKRVIKDGSQTLEIRDENNAVMQRPQEFLNKISGKFIDPFHFSELESKEKRAFLMKHAGLDFSIIDEQISSTEQDRLLVGREVKAIGEVKPVKPVEEKSISDLLQKRGELVSFNEKQEQLNRQKADAKNKLTNLEVEKEELIRKLNELESKIEAVSVDYYNMPEPEPVKDVTAIDTEIANLEENNKLAIAYKQYLEKREAKKQKEDEYATLTEKIKTFRDEKDSLLKNVKLPMDGLVITDAGLEYNGISDNNWSTSQSIKISASISAAYGSDLKVMYVKRGESLDSESLVELSAFAETNDYQIVIEIVDNESGSSADGIFYIEEGEVL
ncbi:MAG: AAA family ATPase [Spirochaetes bacterium]|jgi:uncharacterized protein YhaN|nr:AAA family ATPase [Spirochaetota bacterium]